MIRRLLLFIMWFVALPFLSLHAQSPGGVVRPAEGDSTTAGNQSMRVVTFKAVPGTERTYYYHRDHLRFSLQRMKPKVFFDGIVLTRIIIDIT